MEGLVPSAEPASFLPRCIMTCRVCMPKLLFSWFVGICACVALPLSLCAQQQTLGSIVGRVRVVRGSSPTEPVLVSLEFRSAIMDSVYTDSSGTYGFHNLYPNPYYVVVNDDGYEPARLRAVVEAAMLAPTAMVDMTSVPEEAEK